MTKYLHTYTHTPVSVMLLPTTILFKQLGPKQEILELSNVSICILCSRVSRQWLRGMICNTTCRYSVLKFVDVDIYRCRNVSMFTTTYITCLNSYYTITDIDSLTIYLMQKFRHVIKTDTLLKLRTKSRLFFQYYTSGFWRWH